MMITIPLLEYPIASNIVFFSLVLWFLKSNEAGFRRDRRRNHCRVYQRDGVLCGGIVTDRKMVGDKQYIRYAYRLPRHFDTVYVKDFVEAPEELKPHHKNIIVVLFPKYSKSGIHYGVLQKLMSHKQVARNDSNIGYKAFLRLCLLQGVMVLWSNLGMYFFWTCQLLLYVALCQLWRIHKTEEEATGVVEGVWNTLHRHGPQPKSWMTFVRQPNNRLGDESVDDVFLALDKSECMLAQIVESLDPESEDYGRAFPCEKYFSIASRCQQALQKETAMLDTSW